jgi:hypothetical protein
VLQHVKVHSCSAWNNCRSEPFDLGDYFATVVAEQKLSLELSRSEIGELNTTRVPNMEKNRLYMPKYTTRA